MPFQATGRELLAHKVKAAYRIDQSGDTYVVGGKHYPTVIHTPDGSVLRGDSTVEGLALLWISSKQTKAAGLYGPLEVCELAAAHPELFTREQLTEIGQALASAHEHCARLRLSVNRALSPHTM